MKVLQVASVADSGGACTPTAPACLHLPEEYFIEKILVSVNSLFNYLLLCFDSFQALPRLAHAVWWWGQSAAWHSRLQ